MSQDQRHKDLDDVRVPHAAAPGHPEAGKQPRTADSAAEIERLKAEVRLAYVGQGDAGQKGVMDHKLQGVDDASSYLAQQSDALGPDLLATAVKIGASAAAGALGVATGGSVILGAVIAGGTATAFELMDRLGRANLPDLDPIAFCSKYETSLRLKWPGSVDLLFARMHTLEGARAIHRDVLAMSQDPQRAELVVANQKNELMDAWINALKAKTQKETDPGDMGTKGFEDSTAGRLHIEGIVIDGINKDPPTVGVNGLKAKVTGLPKLARQQFKDRRVNDIRVSRTVEGRCTIPASTHPGPSFAFGRLPDGTPADPKQDEVDATARAVLARVDGAGTWEEGVKRVWNKIRFRTLRQLGVSTVDN